MSRPPRFLRRLALVSALLLPLSACSGTSSNTTTETTAPATTASAPQTSAQTADGDRVQLCTVTDGGHTWPGTSREPPAGWATTQEINASELMWGFFSKHSRN